MVRARASDNGASGWAGLGDGGGAQHAGVAWGREQAPGEQVDIDAVDVVSAASAIGAADGVQQGDGGAQVDGDTGVLQNGAGAASGVPQSRAGHLRAERQNTTT